eukprot:4653526-Prymnesium_polylepis.1
MYVDTREPRGTWPHLARRTLQSVFSLQLANDFRDCRLAGMNIHTRINIARGARAPHDPRSCPHPQHPRATARASVLTQSDKIDDFSIPIGV